MLSGYNSRVHNRSSTKRPADINQLAKFIVNELTSKQEQSAPEELPPEKNPAGISLGKLSGNKGRPARAAKLSPKKRKAIAKKDAQARWKK